MYKNFKITEEEKKQILEQHKSHGYKTNINEQIDDSGIKKEKPLYKRIVFENGCSVSIQASKYGYCQPRNDSGPYTEVELGFPSQDCKLPKALQRYAENKYDENPDPHDTVYAYVPIKIVKLMIKMNGGVKSGELPPFADGTGKADDSYSSQVLRFDESNEMEMDEDNMGPSTQSPTFKDDMMSSDVDMKSVVNKIGLSPEEVEALIVAYKDMGGDNLEHEVENMISQEYVDSDMDNYDEMDMNEGEEMSDKEYKIRSAIDKIVNKTGVISALGIVPASMFISGSAGFAAGVVAFISLLAKDAAWWKNKRGGTGHEFHDMEMNKSRKDWYDKGITEL